MIGAGIEPLLGSVRSSFRPPSSTAPFDSAIGLLVASR